MGAIYRSNKFSTIYTDILDDLLDYAEVSECRDAHPASYEFANDNKLEQKRSMYNVIFELTNPQCCRLVNPVRQPSNAVGIKEAIMIFSSSNDTKYMKWYTRFTRNGCNSNSMYGHWINPMLDEIVTKLAVTPNTRQCVFNIYDNKLGSYYIDGKDITDVPCTLMGIFDIVDHKLNLTIMMRSNDIYLGTPYNIQMFCYLLQVVANELNIPVGTYTHYVRNLHLYVRDEQEMYEALKVGFKPANMISSLNLNQARNAAYEYMSCVDNGIKWKPSSDIVL